VTEQPTASGPECNGPTDQAIVLNCENVAHWFGDHHVLFDVNVKIIRGEIVSLVGPSGCGKSTLLRAIVGTHPPHKGRIMMGVAGKESSTLVSGPGRDRGIVYQQYSLFPFLTAQQNVAMGLMLDQTSLLSRFFGFFKWRKKRKQHLAQAAELLTKLKLGNAINLYPHQMSGGMRQRVAIAQALIMKPEILLLDEPFGALDEATREELQRMLLNLYLENCEAKKQNKPAPYTILIVTHELNEAVYVGDRVVGLSQFWDWKQKGHDKCPGATIVYDQMAPVYEPDQEKDFEDFIKHRDRIRTAAFDPSVLQAREVFLKFWEEVNNGKGKGVLA
jgi:NitT/TauT family transport system ATP-binding protein